MHPSVPSYSSAPKIQVVLWWQQCYCSSRAAQTQTSASSFQSHSYRSQLNLTSLPKFGSLRDKTWILSLKKLQSILSEAAIERLILYQQLVVSNNVQRSALLWSKNDQHSGPFVLTLKDGGLNHFGAAAEEINGDWDLISHHTCGLALNQPLGITFWERWQIIGWKCHLEVCTYVCRM